MHTRIPIVVIVGRPNVGKSTLFNRMVRRRVSIVAPEEGVTRDRVSAVIQAGEKYFDLVDTAGAFLSEQTEAQTQKALDGAALVLLVVDVKTGMVTGDEFMAKALIEQGRNVVVVANKADNFKRVSECVEFHRLGVDPVIPCSAKSGLGVSDVLTSIVERVPRTASPPQQEVRVAIVGRRNAGKSTLLNRIVGEERMVVSNEPGTTRDAVDVAVRLHDRIYTFVDTAGMLRKSKIRDNVEFYSIVRSREAIQRCDVALFLLDCSVKIGRVEKQLSGYLVRCGKPCILVMNKWDLAEGGDTERFQDYAAREIPALSYSPVCFVSALTGFNVDESLRIIPDLLERSRMHVSTAQINRAVKKIAERTPPPARGGRMFKVYYTTQTGVHPPTFTMFVNDPELLTRSYRRFLERRVREECDLHEVPLRLRVEKERIGLRCKVAEIYRTIQGESTYAGLPCVMVRLAGCNLDCSYCDTPEARSGGRFIETEEIVRQVRTLGPDLVEVTGGEPLVQEGAPDLLKALVSAGFRVLLETNGSLPIENVPAGVVKIYDIKCPGSGEADRNRWKNLTCLQERDQIKFVLCDRADYDWAKGIIEQHSLGRFQVLLSPVRGRLKAAALSSWILEDSLNARLNLQLHRIIRPGGEPSPDGWRGDRASGPTVVLLSGGVDSTTMLALAKEQGFDVYALTFDYGQRHFHEIACAGRAAQAIGVVEHRIVKINLSDLARSALTGTGEVPKGRDGIGSDIPPTYVPARNLIFLSVASAWAESLGSTDIFIGVSAVDYSGYPDCRPEFISSFQETLGLATKTGVEGCEITVHAPFLDRTKADVVRKGLALGVDYRLTLSCYDPFPDGSVCGVCDSCILRRRAFEAAGGGGDPTLS